MDVVIIPDVKPDIDEISPSQRAAATENNIGSQSESAKGSVTASNNNTIKTLTPQQAKSLQQQSQITTSSTSGGGTLYLNSSGGGSVTNSASVRTPAILTTASTVATQQQLQTMGKSSGLNIVHVTLPQVEHTNFHQFSWPRVSVHFISAFVSLYPLFSSMEIRNYFTTRVTATSPLLLKGTLDLGSHSATAL